MSSFTYALLSGRAMPRYQSVNNRNIKYLISSSGNRTHNLSRLQSHFVPQNEVEV